MLYLLGGRLARPRPGGDYAVSVITEMELLSFPNLTPTEEACIRQFIANVTLIELSAPVRAIAIELRRAHRLKLPDAAIAASAMSMGAELLSNDERLVRTPGLRCRSVAVV